MDIESFPALLEQVSDEIGKVVFGSQESIRLMTIAVLVKGHLLLEGPPGVAKTLLVRAFSRCLGLDTRRVQCTPDLMPGDVLGANIFDFKSQQFSLNQGPVFTEFLLVDEINRTPPKTQSALLEAMQERSVTIDGVTYKLSELFTVMATQNPLEHEGTYPLPEAQLDRFLFQLNISYPDSEQELQAVLAHCQNAGMPEVDPVQPLLDRETLATIQALPEQVRVEPDVAKYAVELARATREHRSLAVGISPRATTMLVAACRGAAVCEGRNYIVPYDVKSLFLSAVRHRVILSPAAEMDGSSIDDILLEVSEHVPVPR